jgi:hypothetical protein
MGGGTPPAGMNWLPPERSGPPMPRVRRSERGFRVPKWAAVLAVILALASIGWNASRMLNDDGATPDTVRLGTQFGVDIAQREVLKYRAKNGRWPVSLAEVDMAGWQLTYTAEESRFEISGSDGSGGIIMRSGTLDDVPKAPEPKAGAPDSTGGQE